MRANTNNDMNSDGRMLQLVCASTNPDKAAEIAVILEDVAMILSRPEGMGEVEENAPDLQGNALLKARAVSRFAGAAAVADDTGLEVAALNGAPGVFSARYAGLDATDTDNINKLLRDLKDVEVSARGARFRTVIAVCWPDGSELTTEGSVEGWIATEERGSAGFGYDCIFIPAEGDRRTFAEMKAAEKNRLSHRGRALRALADLLKEKCADGGIRTPTPAKGTGT